MQKSIRRVVAVDHEAALLERLREAVSGPEVVLETFRSPREALDYISGTSSVDVVVCGVEMPGCDGTFVDAVKAIDRDIQIVALGDTGRIREVVDFVDRGAHSFLTKPFSPDEFKSLIARIDEDRSSEPSAAKIVEPEGCLHGIVGNHIQIRRLVEKIRRTSELPTDTNILLYGESGTGKELVARAIHLVGAGSHEPFVAVNCAAINGNLLEDQLFGHVRGAFTGADTDRDGVFVAAGNGTLFLDEITELPPGLQAKLLRAIQEREVSPVGSDVPRPWRARLVVATNRNLETAVENGDFRRDLYFRVNVIRLDIPPLRDRLEDVPLLAEFFLARFNEATGKCRVLSEEALQFLSRHPFRGNVRQLRNALEHAHALARTDTIEVADLPDDLRDEQSTDGTDDDFPVLATVERNHIIRALQKANGKKVVAARYLGVERNRLYRLIRKLDIQPKEFT